MSITCVKDDRELCHIKIEDEMTIYTAAEHKDALTGHITDCHDIEVDLSAVSELDSAGLQLLMMLKNLAVEGERKVQFNHHSRAVVEVIELLNLVVQFGDPMVIPAEWQA